jgi:hypothetical protein
LDEDAVSGDEELRAVVGGRLGLSVIIKKEALGRLHKPYIHTRNTQGDNRGHNHY